MTNKPNFDFSAFVAAAQNPDPEFRNETLRDAVSDEMEAAMAEVAPRIWAVLQREMKKDSANNIHLNAVLNAALFAVLGWTAACTPRGETNGADNDEVLRDKVLKNVANALSNARDQGGEMSRIAHNVGQLKLLEDAMSGMGEIVVANSMIIKGIHTTIKNQKPPA
tara:strand:+ start:1218 stop:1715 length:498 start_codon:yes stop_codon:yes gene_type:complete